MKLPLPVETFPLTIEAKLCVDNKQKPTMTKSTFVGDNNILIREFLDLLCPASNYR
jgi:hypothetical protein